MITDINKATLEDFIDLPTVTEWDPTIKYTGIVILPSGHLHDSGWGSMYFIPENNGKATFKISGYSDCLHIDGIGGFGKSIAKTNWENPKPIGWRIDCLQCGLIRVFARLTLDESNFALSDFAIYGVR